MQTRFSGRFECWWLGESDQQLKPPSHVFLSPWPLEHGDPFNIHVIPTHLQSVCECFITVLLSKDEWRRGIFHSSCRHAPAPDCQQWIFGGTRTAGSTTEDVDFVAKWGPRGGSPGTPAEKEEPHCLRHQLGLKIFGDTNPRPKLRLPVRSPSSRSFQGSAKRNRDSFEGCWAHPSCPPASIATVLLLLGGSWA